MNMKRCEYIVEGSFERLLRFSRFLGIAPVRMQKLGSACLVRVCGAYDVIGRFFGTVICAMSVTCFLMDLQNFNTPKAVLLNTLTTSMLFFCELIIKLALLLMGIFGASSRVKRFMHYIKTSKKINQSCVYHKFPKTNGSKKTTAVAVLMLVACSILVLSECWMIYRHVNNAADVAIYLHWIFLCEDFVVLFTTFQVTLITSHVQKTLKEINNNLEMFINEVGKNNHRASTKGWDSQEKFTRLTDSYLSACNLVRQINKNEGSLLLLLLSHGILSLVIVSFHGIIIISLPDTASLRTPIVAQKSTWFLYNVFIIVLLIEPCHCTQEEIDEVKILMGRLLCTLGSFYDPLLMDMERFYKQLMFQKPLYSPLNICTLERSIVTTVIAVLTSCLVAFFQIH